MVFFFWLDSIDMIGNALFLIGEIGGNDYNYPFFVHKNIEEVKELVPLVISTISTTILVNILDRSLKKLYLLRYFWDQFMLESRS